VKLCPTCGQQWPDDQKFCPNDGSALKTAGRSDLVGSVIAERYHIQKKLGEGGMGAVYLGEHVKMGRKSAIKVMTRAMAADPDAIARFNREAASAARINHPNVCAIYDFGETEDGLIYLAMEFIQGESLSDLLEREGALPPKRAAAIFQQAADALQAAHDLGIVHRDLKPDNIMLTKGRGGTDIVKVVDFGIAKAIGGEEGQKVTKTGLVVGTPEYMAGDRLDGRSDLYSLTLVLYRMLTGTLPFQADSAQEVMIKRLTDEPTPLNQARPGAEFPANLQAVMKKALQRMPSDRYTSAAELARDVTQAVSTMADAAPPVDTQGATQMMSAVPGGPTNIARTRVAGTRTQTPDTPAVARPATAVQAPPRKRAPAMAIAAAAGVLVVGGGLTAVILSSRATIQPPAAAEDSTKASAVTEDTARQVAVRHPSGPPIGGAANRTNAGRVVTPPHPKDTMSALTEVPGSHGIAVSVADAGDRLNTLFDRFDASGHTPASIAAGIRDTALAYYNAKGIALKDQAFAAYLVANAQTALDNKSEALYWARLAVKLDPMPKSYQVLVTDLSREP
jgi:hypothetical protein